MTTYAITYDLHQPEQDYDDLYDTIKGFGVWWHCLESFWLVDTDMDTDEMRDEVADVTGSNDDVLVFEASKPWHSWGLSEECEDWLHDHMSA